MTAGEFSLLVVIVLLDSVEHVLYKMAALYPEHYIEYILPAGVLYVGSIVLWLWVLRSVPIGIATPFMGMSYGVTAILSVHVFNEKIDGRRWLGIVVIAIGVALLGGEQP